MSDRQIGEDRPKTSMRDHGALREQLTRWLQTKVAGAEITEFTVPGTTGMSSETILFSAEWTEAGADGTGSRTDRFVLRLPPDSNSEPVFRVYDMPLQFNAMRLVGQRTDVPVPPTLWLETDPSHLGAPFFVMGRVDGVVPPDLLPYTWGDNWFYDAAPAEQATLQRASVEVLAKIHTISAADPDAAFLAIEAPGDTALRRHLNDQRAYYEWVAADGTRSPLIERAFAWLEDNWPAAADDPAREVVSWGDARVGNMLYRDFLPVAVLDWEMAGHAVPEVDLGWMIFLHRFFQDLSEMMGQRGIPDFMRTADVCAQYRELSGVEPVAMHWFITYAALRHAIVMFRITRRQILFGEAVMPDNPDHAFTHHATLAAMLDGSYWIKL